MKQLEEKLKKILIHPYTWIALGIFPCFFAACIYIRAVHKLDHLQEEVLYLYEKKQSNQRKTNLEQKLLTQLGQANSAYLEKELETLRFLQPEVQKIKALLHTEPNNALLQTRLDFLQNEQNQLRFRQHNFQRIGKFQEMEALQDHPVEMNREDLKQLLALIENQKIGDWMPGSNPPDLIVKSFELIKKPLPSNEEIFFVNLELIKREMLHE